MMKSQLGRIHLSHYTFIALCLVAVSIPLFFEIYRVTIFGTVSYDDYARYLLWIVNEPGGAVPPSPFAYRIGSVALAAPFFEIPLISLAGGRAGQMSLLTSASHLRATQALCAANVFYVVAAAGTVVFYLDRHCRLDVSYAAIGGFATIFFATYLALQSVDGISLFFVIVCLVMIAERRTYVYLVFIVASLCINEKVVLICLTLTATRVVFCSDLRRSYFPLLLISFAAFLLYLLLVRWIAVPGNQNQTDVTTFLPAASEMLRSTFTLKGAVLNLWPVVALAAMWTIAVRQQVPDSLVRKADVAVLIVLTATAFALNVRFNVGRIVMFSAPWYVIGVVYSLGKRRSPIRSGVLDSSM